MENFTKKSVDAFEEACRMVGAYLGYMYKSLDKLEQDVKESSLGFWKTRTAKGAIRKIRKVVSKSDRDLTALVEELGKLMFKVEEDEFLEKCAKIRRIVNPLFAKSRYQLQELNKVINLVKFVVKQKGA